MEDKSIVELYGALSEIIPGFESLRLGVDAANQTISYVEYKDRSIPLSLAGDGVRMLVEQLLKLVPLKDGVALMEEPEVHKHPAAITQTAKAIFAAVRRGVQVILTLIALS